MNKRSIRPVDKWDLNLEDESDVRCGYPSGVDIDTEMIAIRMRGRSVAVNHVDVFTIAYCGYSAITLQI